MNGAQICPLPEMPGSRRSGMPSPLPDRRTYVVPKGVSMLISVDDMGHCAARVSYARMNSSLASSFLNCPIFGMRPLHSSWYVRITFMIRTYQQDGETSGTKG